MTLKEQVDQLQRIAGNPEMDVSDRKIMLQCAATIYDFWMDARQEVMECYSDDDHNLVSSSKVRMVDLRTRNREI